MGYRFNDQKALMSYVARKLKKLQAQYVEGDQSSARADLARLRRQVSKEPLTSPDTWEFEFDGFPGEIAGVGATAPTAGEYAAHLAFTLYAVHQQSLKTEMFRETRSAEQEWHGLGHAVHQMAYLSKKNEQGEQLEQGQMPRRFVALVTAQNIEETGHYARQLVQQLRGMSIPLDYGRLAGQLYGFCFRTQRDRVRREWGREFAQWREPQKETASNED